jgi:hypothetical protein
MTSNRKDKLIILKQAKVISYFYCAKRRSTHIFSSYQKGSRGSKVQKAWIGKGLLTATFLPIGPQGSRNANLFLGKPLNQFSKGLPCIATPEATMHHKEITYRTIVRTFSWNRGTQ